MLTGIETGPIYQDRLEAAASLAASLEEYRGQHPVVFGIPRGGVPVAAEIARRLDEHPVVDLVR